MFNALTNFEKKYKITIKLLYVVAFYFFQYYFAWFDIDFALNGHVNEPVVNGFVTIWKVVAVVVIVVVVATVGVYVWSMTTGLIFWLLFNIYRMLFLLWYRTCLFVISSYQ